MAAALCLVVMVPVHATGQRPAPGAADNVADGFVALREGRYGDALEVFERALRFNPRNPEVLLGAGVATLMLGDYAEAQERIEQALAIEPRVPEAYLLLGQALYRQGKLAEAIDALESGLKYRPGDADLSDQLLQWQKESQTQERFFQSQSAHFSVLFEGPADQALAYRCTEILEAAYWRIGGVLTVYPSRTIQVVLYTTEQFRDITRSPTWAAGAADGRIKVPIRGGLDQPEELERVLGHELVHVMVGAIAGPTLPGWLNEGLATALEPGGLERSEQQLASTDTRLPLTALLRGFGSLSAEQVSLAYAQSAMAVQRLLDLRSSSGMVNLLQAVGRGVPFERAFQEAIFMSYQDFANLFIREP